ncbi:MAG: DUF1934 domain-containing protein [Oscillospiraceae bacterium]|nr:DUF1934 domain-containing protein [Candidatus Equicaccousia limihippi]
MKNVVITIKGKSYSDSKPPEETEVQALGNLKSGNGVVSVTYDDTMGAGFDNITATLKAFDNGLVTIERKGVMEHKLMIEKDKRHQCVYNTPYGDMTVGIFGETVEGKLTSHGGRLFMKYSLDINSGLISENEIEINVKETN